MADATQLAEALADMVAAFSWGDMNAGEASAINQARQALAAFEAQAATAAEPVGEVQTYTGSILDGVSAPFNRVVWKDGIQPPPGTKLYAAPVARAAAAAEPKQEPAPVQFACWCADNGLQIFDTHDEAMEYANETLREYRRAATFDGEWSGDVDSMWVGAVHITHKPATTEADEEGGVDYELKGAALVAQPEPRKPLTDEQKENLVTAHFPEQRKRVLALIAAVEKFYGIKENPNG